MARHPFLRTYKVSSNINFETPTVLHLLEEAWVYDLEVSPVLGHPSPLPSTQAPKSPQALGDGHELHRRASRAPQKRLSKAILGLQTSQSHVPTLPSTRIHQGSPAKGSASKTPWPSLPSNGLRQHTWKEGITELARARSLAHSASANTLQALLTYGNLLQCARKGRASSPSIDRSLHLKGKLQGTPPAVMASQV